jgi:Na+/H+-dicarboxylate symporter
LLKVDARREFLCRLFTTVYQDLLLLAGYALLAQIFGVTLGARRLLIALVKAVAASIGSPATPGMGIVALAKVLEGAGAPVAGSALLREAHRPLDMYCTTINVTGDLTACVVLNRWTAEAVPAAATSIAMAGR